MRNEILDLLNAKRGAYISGEEISNRLGVTRAAVWKYIKVLKNEGYVIESASKKGYRLISLPDRLEAVFIQRNLKTKELGKTVEYYSSTDSTNAKAKALALEGQSHGTVVLAEEQTLGKGRMGRSWISPYGTGIWMSMILRPNIAPADAPKFTLMGAVAVAKAIKGMYGLSVGIKWPNDIILSGKKVCGILTELNADMDRIHWIVLGIGINVNMTEEDFPEDIRSMATSLYLQTGEHVDRSELVKRICEELESLYDLFVGEGDFTAILEDCRNLSVTLGRQVRVIGHGIEMNGFAEGFDENGSLLVRREDGIVENIISGDVSVRGLVGYV